MTLRSETVHLHSQELGACALVQDLLPLYLEGEVSPGSRDLITEHLARCERCAGFLAGAQTVRAQLRRDQGQRTQVLKADAPARTAVLRWRELLAGTMALLLCVPGGVAVAFVGAAFLGSDTGLLVLGVLIGGVLCAAVLGLARVVAPLTSQRLRTILGGCALGSAGVLVLQLAINSSNNLIGVLAALAIGLAGLVAVWSGVARDGRLPLG